MREVNAANAAIGARIQKLRKKRKLTQEVFAEKIELGGPHQISDIERGLCGLSISSLIRICQVLDIDADYLLFGTSTRNPDNPINKYLAAMPPEQSRQAEEFIATYAKTLCKKEEE